MPYRIAALVLLAVGLPLAAFWFAVASVPAINPDDAKALFAKSPSDVLLLDVRPLEAFNRDRIEGSFHWSADEILSLQSPAEIPSAAQGKTLLALCESGLMSARAVKKLRQLGAAHAYVVSGGIADWKNFSGGRCSTVNLKRVGLSKQWLSAITAIIIKPLYLIMSFAMIAWLWKRRETDLASLRWGLILFWLGENACAVNYLAYGGRSHLWEYLHNFGMASGFSFFIFAFIDGTDRRLLKFSAAGERCALLGLCRGCIKNNPVRCGLQELFKLFIPAFIVVAALPLCAPMEVISYNVDILGTAQNYSQLMTSQLFEARYCPVLALLLLATSWLVLLFGRREPILRSKILFAAGLGPLAFSLLRVFLFHVFSQDLLLFVFWEEATELLFITAVAYILWQFRTALFTRPQQAAGV